MTKKPVGNFTVEADVVLGVQTTKRVRQHQLGGEHRVRVNNRSTLAYDVIVESKLPDPKPPRALSYTLPGVDQWQASWPCLSGSTTVDKSYPLDVHGPPAAGQRLWSHELRYRLANSAIGLSTSGFWISKTGQPLPIDISVTVL